MALTEPNTDLDVSSHYVDNHEYLLDELYKLDLMLYRCVQAMKQKKRTRIDPAGQHYYITHEEVLQLLSSEYALDEAQNASREKFDELIQLQENIDAKVIESANRDVYLVLPRLVQLFRLSELEKQVILICLAPELNRKYDRLYAYLQDDLTRKRPSIDLVLQVLFESESDRWHGRALLASQAMLLNSGLLRVVNDLQSPSGSSGLSQFLQLDNRVLAFLLDQTVVDSQLEGYVKVYHSANASENLAVDPKVQAKMSAFAERYSTGKASQRQLVFHFHGPYGVGKRALALSICEKLKCSMLQFDTTRMPAQVEEEERLLKAAFRESLLLQSPLYVTPADVFVGETERAVRLRAFLSNLVQSFGWFTILAGEKPWIHGRTFEHALFYSMSLSIPDITVREKAWKQAFTVLNSEQIPVGMSRELASRFRLTPGQIQDAASTLSDQQTIQGEEQALTFEAISKVCRAQAHHKLGELATKIEPHYTWDDLVLPEDKLAQLQEMSNQVKDHDKVYRDWGFGKKLAHGIGLSALFTGPPGTGKTMAAEVLAHDLQLDLFKIDLASVVSKYIGETEKNLSCVFDEAQNSNAVLFFDEADALFGKRTEVSDAHDRYANIETSFLLQKMEQYAGIVILASNLQENMDNAFMRRLRFVIEFPFPDAQQRLQIWKSHFPAQAPVDEDVDYELLAKRIHLAGGNIKNIALNAAFFAASNGCLIGMEHIKQSAKREYEKIGKLWNEQSLISS